jgi:hypothetical protein
MPLDTVFLSASVPDPLRDQKYFSAGDTVAIRDAVIALLMVVLPRTRLVFGGHPAITPMVKWVADQLQAFDRVRMFQSRYFQDRYLKDLDLFRYVEIGEVSGDRDESLRVMRRAMIHSEPFSAAFFIGGMEGVEAEYELMKEEQSRVPRFPVYTTGGAARMLWTKELRFSEENPNIRELRTNTSYVGLFTNLLERVSRGT